MRRETLTSPDYAVPVAGFTQMVKTPAKGTLLYISGVTARTADGTIVGVGDIQVQARQVFENLKTLVQYAGGSLDDIVRLVKYYRSMDDHPVVQAMSREFFGDNPPASTSVEISRLFDDRMLLEIEATAVLNDEG